MRDDSSTETDPGEPDSAPMDPEQERLMQQYDELMADMLDGGGAQSSARNAAGQAAR